MDSERDPSERLFTIPEATSSPDSPLNGKCSDSWLYRAAARGKVPGVVRVGRKVYVSASGLRAFLAAGGAR